MSNDINDKPLETRNISGCNVRVFFTEEENTEVKEYVLNSLFNVFEKRNGVSDALNI